eukprot:jgi/Tetstr1/445814/TSEL_033455.t1
MTRQFRRDLEWWVAVPNHSNGRSIYKPVETAYMHVDSSGYGCGAVLYETTEARGFWYEGDRDMHITYKALKAVWYAVLTFLSELRGRQVLLHEDNMGVVHVLASLTSRSPLLMTEMRNLWFILDTNDISIRARYIKTTANIWADRLSREIDYDDWAFSHFNHLDNICCNRGPRGLIDNLVIKLHISGAAATVIVPYWPDRGWHQRLSEMASEVVVFPPSPYLFAPGRLGVQTGVGSPKWPVVAFRLPLRARCPASDV